MISVNLTDTVARRDEYADDLRIYTAGKLQEAVYRKYADAERDQDTGHDYSKD
jgi:hypothetical protein